MQRILAGRAVANIRFVALCALMRYVGFDKGVRGGRYRCRTEGIVGSVSLQCDDGHAERYQVRQRRPTILKAIIYLSNPSEARCVFQVGRRDGPRIGKSTAQGGHAA